MISLPWTEKSISRGVELRLDAHGAEIVAIEVDVENADGDLPLLERFDFGGEPLGQRNPTAADADEGELIEIFGLFENFVRETTRVRSISDALMSWDLPGSEPSKGL